MVIIVLKQRFFVKKLFDIKQKLLKKRCHCF